MRNDVLINHGFRDLNPLFVGSERCRPGKSFGPAVRKYTLIHCVLEGRGRIRKAEGIYEVQAGQAFLILPGEVTTYEADGEDPWVYQWVGFDGALAESFQTLPTVVSLPSTFTQEMLNTEGSELREFRIAALLFQIYATLFGNAEIKHDYVRRVRDHIQALYMQDLRVEEIARSLNLNRRYLSRFFKEKTGQTIQEYLITVRMEEAKRLLLQGKNVSETATLCGYQDPLNFSKMFKRRFSVSPIAWLARQKGESPL
ncbi:MAG: AraC family transcriptional regulator [Clostridia bacterium]|nr:AraC family transcriptional regulator [Clostridia bacterium]